VRIEHIRIENYKGFRDTGQIPIGARFTVVAGQNNSGKTAFLEVMRAGSLTDKPYRRPQQIEEVLPPLFKPKSSIVFGISVSGPELERFLILSGSSVNVPVFENAPAKVQSQIEKLFTNTSLQFSLRYQPNSWQNLSTPIRLSDRDPNFFAVVAATADRQGWHITGVGGGINDTMLQVVVPYFISSIYVFRAERMNIGVSTIDNSPDLQPDASNLPSVLLQLQANLPAKGRFTDHLRTVFPTIFDAISRPVSPTTAQIEVINRAEQGGAWIPGLNVPLNDSGTGISQVLAILYVIVTAPETRTIVIDEPNSFLHPGAAKKLLKILSESGHQYIIATHSSDIVRAVDPDLVHLTKWNGQECVFETLNANNLTDLRHLLRELGVRLSDVFGADNLLWVEGITEERCFPLLLKHAGHELSQGTAIVAVVSPDELGSRRARNALVWEVYERLSSGQVLVPPALAFSFDREGRTDTDIRDMERRSKGQVHFLPRRTYENYLLDDEAISFVLESAGVNKTAGEVHEWLMEHGADRKYFDEPFSTEIAGPSWRVIVRAPQLLHDLFNDLSDQTLEYRKTLHSMYITEWLLQNKPQELDELATYVTGLVHQ